MINIHLYHLYKRSSYTHIAESDGDKKYLMFIKLLGEVKIALHYIIIIIYIISVMDKYVFCLFLN